MARACLSGRACFINSVGPAVGAELRAAGGAMGGRVGLRGVGEGYM